MLGLSTSWNARNFSRAKDLVFEIKAAGFTAVELGFDLSAGMVKEIAEFAEEQEIGVLSLHNFCPIPDGSRREEALPDCYSLASPEEEQRRQALRYTKRTIDTAARFCAKAVVLHCGRVEVPDHTRELISLYEKGLKGSPAFLKLKDEAIALRRKEAAPFFEAALKSIEELSQYSLKSQIALGIETRFYYREIPSFPEIAVILEEFKAGNVFYWHDTGHAQVMENLGFIRHKDYLESYGQRMLGVHLHGVKGCIDHQAPSLGGDFDFRQLKPYLGEETIKIIEAHQPATKEELKASKKYLEEIFDG